MFRFYNNHSIFGFPERKDRETGEQNLNEYETEMLIGILKQFDNAFEKTGNRMKQRIPQMLEIIDDKHHRILYDEKYNTVLHGGHYGRMNNLFKKS